MLTCLQTLTTDDATHTAVVQTRLLYDSDTFYVHWSINQTQTGWDYPLPDLLPINRMFIHGRGATTCSLYIQGNLSQPFKKGDPVFGRPVKKRSIY